MNAETMKKDGLVLLGALAGGFVGYWIFSWMIKQNLYGLIIPGAMAGFGAGLFRPKSAWIPVACGCFALGLGLFTEWRFMFYGDGSLKYFLLHIHQLKPITLLMLAIGTFFGFWPPFRRRERKITKPSSSGKNLPR